MPRSARTEHAFLPSFQTNENGRGLLAWRQQQQNVATYLRYGVGRQKALNAYLQRSEEAAKRDHRKIGKQLDLYHMQEEAPGMVFWHNDGWTIFRELEVFVRSKLKEYQYQEVKGPFMMDRVLWEKTGHWDNYKDAMFTTSSENREYCIKPMNCPGHVQIFNQGLKSYRDLPLRMAEFGSCHRNEPSGSLHGLMRVRGFTQMTRISSVLKNKFAMKLTDVSV